MKDSSVLMSSWESREPVSGSTSGAGAGARGASSGEISRTVLTSRRKLWKLAQGRPDFSKKDLIAACDEYARRNRRFGGL